VSDLKNYSLKGKRFGALEDLMSDSLYARNVHILEKNGAEIVKINPERVQLPGFRTLLSADMKYDLPKYLKKQANLEVKFKSVEDIVEFNKLDSLKRMPYNQVLFDGIVKDSTTLEELEIIKTNLENSGRSYFDSIIDSLKLDAFLSINNYHAGFAAVAKYPCLTVPMGFDKEGEPMNMTFIAKQFEEEKLLKIGYAFEKITNARKSPSNYN
jgi:amidase